LRILISPVCRGFGNRLALIGKRITPRQPQIKLRCSDLHLRNRARNEKSAVFEVMSRNNRARR